MSALIEDITMKKLICIAATAILTTYAGCSLAVTDEELERQKKALNELYASEKTSYKRAAISSIEKAAREGSDNLEQTMRVTESMTDGLKFTDEDRFRFYRIGAEQGHGSYQVILAEFYLEGIGVKKEYGKAKEWLKKAVHRPLSIHDNYRLAKAMLDYPELKLQSDGANFMINVCTRGRHAEGCYRAGILFKEGKLVEKNEEIAAAAFKLAREKGSISAILRYSDELLKSGKEGRKEAFVMWKKYADIGVERESENLWFDMEPNEFFVDAWYRLGIMHRDGIGTERNMEKAKEWLRRASEAGHPEAKIVLGLN